MARSAPTEVRQPASAVALDKVDPLTLADLFARVGLVIAEQARIAFQDRPRPDRLIRPSAGSTTRTPGLARC
jgi:hypothetical protein